MITQGNWIVEDRCHRASLRVSAGPTGIADVFWRTNPAEQEANARLLAAAPKMLAALKQALLVLVVTDRGPITQAVQDALAAATGETP